MRAFGEKAREPRLCLRDGIGRCHADGVKAALPRLRNKRLLEGDGLGQKSRSA
jgi:hypothetical protein